MLGFHPLLERELRKKGHRAMAKVIEAHQGHMAVTSGNLPQDQIANTRVNWTLTLSVEPEGEAPFEVKIDTLLHTDTAAGEYLPVLYDPDDHSKVVVDQSPEGVQAQVNQRIEQSSADRIARMRAAGNDVMADRFQTLLDSGLETNWSTDPVERRKQIEERKAKMRELMGAGAGPTIMVGGQQIQPAAAPAAPDAASTVDALAKLADLHDRGVLTDAEFQAQKQKLLAAD